MSEYLGAAHRGKSLAAIWAVLVALSLLVACGSANARWSNGQFSVALPTGWIPEKSDGTDFTVVDAPSGPGRLAFVKIVSKNPPALTAATALDAGQRGVASAGLPTEGLEAKAAGTDHFVVNAAGESRGEHVVAAVHVFSGGIVLVGYFHTPDQADPNLAVAASILQTVMPESQ